MSLLIPRLGGGEAQVDMTVLFALDSLATQAQEAVPAVVPLLQNRDPSVARRARSILVATGIGSNYVVAALEKLIDSKSASVDQRLEYAKIPGSHRPCSRVVPSEFCSRSSTRPTRQVRRRRCRRRVSANGPYERLSSTLSVESAGRTGGGGGGGGRGGGAGGGGGGGGGGRAMKGGGGGGE